MIKYFTVILAGLSIFCIVEVLFGCLSVSNTQSWQHVELFPADSSQVITIMTQGDYRYIANGRYNALPTSNYLKLDMSRVDALGNGVSVCWSTGKRGWELASAYATQLESSLDSNYYRFSPSLGKYGEPRIGKYEDEGCGSVLIRESRGPQGDLMMTYR